ncbi:hypothetical protein GCM10023336_04960 [Streptomyces similanensis]|uniref:Uncharacterized protein n=1 Tax=Streptomyces similanensis TaxID=1274988 RepID=A0ABP9JW50_9ACTN
MFRRPGLRRSVAAGPAVVIIGAVIGNVVTGVAGAAVAIRGAGVASRDALAALLAGGCAVLLVDAPPAVPLLRPRNTGDHLGGTRRKGRIRGATGAAVGIRPVTAGSGLRPVIRCAPLVRRFRTAVAVLPAVWTPGRFPPAGEAGEVRSARAGSRCPRRNRGRPLQRPSSRRETDLDSRSSSSRRSIPTGSERAEPAARRCACDVEIGERR